MNKPVDPVVLRDSEGRYWMGGTKWTRDVDEAWRWDNVTCAARSLQRAMARRDVPPVGTFEISFEHAGGLSLWTLRMDYPNSMSLEPKEDTK